MIFDIISTQTYENSLIPEGYSEIKIERIHGSRLKIRSDYQAAYGMGEKFDAVNQKGKTVENQVIEKFCNQGKFSYCVTPFFVTDAGFGIYVETDEKTVFSFLEEIECTIPENARVYIFTGTIAEIIRDYNSLFPKLEMLPKYAFGIWVSANHWKSEKDVRNLITSLEKYDYPADVVVLEAWSDEATFYIWNGAKHNARKSDQGFRYEDFDFEESRFWKNPKKMIEELHDRGLKLVLWQIPVFKKQDAEEEQSEQLAMDKEYAIEHHLVVKNQDGTPYTIPDGNWFAGSVIPDFTNPETKKFWFQKRQYLSDIGVDGYKTDGGEFIYDENISFFNGMTGKSGKNRYCQEYINAYHEFITENQVLFSRAGYAGMSHTPVLWAGDHQSTNEELKNVLNAGLSAAMSGIFFWSFDIGGFAGELPTIDLYRRSTQMAVFSPIMQWHSEPDGGQFKDLMPGAEGNNERSPWNVALANKNPEFIDEIRYWHKLRETLIPYIYNMALRTVEENKPMMRPLIYDYQKDAHVAGIDDEYMFGDNLLVAPYMEENQTSRKVYLPQGQWYDFFTNQVYEGGRYYQSDVKSKMPVYIKAGKAIPVCEDGKQTILLYGSKGSDYLDSCHKQIDWEENGLLKKEECEKQFEWKIIK